MLSAIDVWWRTLLRLAVDSRWSNVLSAVDSWWSSVLSAKCTWWISMLSAADSWWCSVLSSVDSWWVSVLSLSVVGSNCRYESSVQSAVYSGWSSCYQQ